MASAARRAPCAIVLAALVALAGCGSAKHTSTSAVPVALVEAGEGLRAPAGLRASVYAHGPQAAAGFAFDARGRLWVAAAGLSKHDTDGVYLIARSGAKPVKVISGLDDPIGLLWLKGRLYVASVGRVDVYSGLHGHRFASDRALVAGPVAGAENNDLALAPDGRLVMGVTSLCDHCKPGSPLSGSIVSFRPDGSGLKIYARGIRAPFGLAFQAHGGELLASMNQRDDLGARTPGDWLGVVSEGEDWGFPGCYGQGGKLCAGVPKPLAVLDKHAAAGTVIALDGQLGSKIGDAVLVSEWQSAKVLQIAPHAGAGVPAGRVQTLLTGIPNPLAMALAPDRSLLVGDWASGTIYRVASSGGG